MTNENRLKNGTVLRDRYVIQKSASYERWLGIPYVAYDISLGRNIFLLEAFRTGMCARIPGEVQVIDVKRNEFERLKEIFQRYGQMLLSFRDCPNLPKAYEFFEENGTCYLSQELMQGNDLLQYKRMKGFPRPEVEILHIAAGILNALKYLHGLGCVHRDVCMGNVFLTERGAIKLIGVDNTVKMEELRNSKFSLNLNTGYAAPEEYRRKGNVGPWSDLYAAGAILYNLATGKIAEESLERLVGDTLRPPKEYNPDISDRLNRVIMKALNLDIRRRYQSAAEFYGDLFHCHTGG